MAVYSYPYSDSYADSYYYEEQPVEESQEYLEAVAHSYEQRAARARQSALDARRRTLGHPAQYSRGVPAFEEYEEPQYYSRPPPPVRYERIQHRPTYDRAPVRQPAPRVQSRNEDLEAQFLRDLAIEDYDAAFEEWKASRRQARRAPQPEQRRSTVAPRRVQVAPAPTRSVVHVQHPAPTPRPRAAPVDLLSLILDEAHQEPRRAPRAPVRHEEPPVEVQDFLSLLGLAPPTRPAKQAPCAQPRQRAPQQPQHPEIGEFLQLFGIDPSTLSHASKPSAPAQPATQQAAPNVPAQLQDILGMFGLPGVAASQQPAAAAPSKPASQHHASPSSPQVPAHLQDILSLFGLPGAASQQPTSQHQTKSSAPSGEPQGFADFFQALQGAFAQQFGADGPGAPHAAGPSSSAAGPSGTSSAPSASQSQPLAAAKSREERERDHLEAELLKQAIAASLETPSNAATDRPASPTHSDKGKNKDVPVYVPTVSENLAALERTFGDLTNGSFDFPAVIDFTPSPTSRSASPTPGPELAHTPRNAALRQQTNSLNALLAQVDAIEGDEGIRARRKDLAQSVEAALDDLDTLIWSKWRSERGQQSQAEEPEPEQEVEVKGYDVETPKAQAPAAPASDDESFDVVTVEAKPESVHEDTDKA